MFCRGYVWWSWVVMAGLCVGCSAHSQESPPPKQYDVIVHSLKVHTTKANGAAWDILGGAPDLKVTVTKLGKFKSSHTTQVKRDVFEALIDEKTVRVSEGDEIELHAIDEDVNLDDTIGKKTIKITKEMLQEGEAKLTFDRVILLLLKLEPVQQK